MAGELTITSANWLDFRTSTGAVPMPFQQEIFLDDVSVAGTMHVDDITAKCEKVKVGDELALKREPYNQYDERAIRVETTEGVKLGYVPRRRNPVYSHLMDAGKLLVAKLKEKNLDDGCYVDLKIGIYMKDI